MSCAQCATPRKTTVSDEAKIAVSPEEAAARIGVSRTKMFDLVKTGRIRSFKLDRRRLVAVSDLATFVAEQVA